jgi:hypothetical protein
MVQTAILAVASELLVAAVAVATDETTSTWRMRAARFAAFAPVSASVAVLVLAARLRANGELRALEALGTPPWRALGASQALGQGLGLAGALLLLTPWADSSSLFPAVRPGADWVFGAAGDFAQAPGVTLLAGGAMVLGARAVPAASIIAGASALPCLVPLALVLPAWSVTPMTAELRGGSGLAAASCALAVLHLIAAGRTPSLVGGAAVFPLVIATVIGRR